MAFLKVEPRAPPKRSDFYDDVEFCGECGAIDDPNADQVDGFTECKRCGAHWPAKDSSETEASVSYEIVFAQPKTAATSGEAGGPQAERECSKCGHERMTYSTRQTRSADEGMTVFFTCLSCGNRDIEYS